jgi:glycosyltransferase involved in cell wall biosynthesis
MPVHDAGQYLQTAVDSILGQSCPDLELLLVNDHSTDGAIAGLNLSDARLKVLQSRGRGVVSAFNTGLACCKGQFIARMDADDISLPRRLEAQLEYLEQHPCVDIAGCCVEIFSEAGIQGGLQRYQQWLNSVLDPEQIHRQVFIESPLPNPGLTVRRGAMDKLGGYLDVEWPEDYDLLLRADAAGMQMGKPEAVLLHWREHDSRITHTDPRYTREQFMRAKAHFLVNHRLKGQRLIIWGAGPTGRGLYDLISAEGGAVEGFIEVHPRRIGGQKRGLPVWSIDKCTEAGSPVILVAVGTAGARKDIAAFMQQHEKVEGEDYLFVA